MPAGDVGQTPPAGDDPYTAVLDRRRRQRLAQLGYRTQVVPQPGGQFYWHAWLRDDRINGGLSETSEKAEEVAQWVILQHSWQHYPRLLGGRVDSANAVCKVVLLKAAIPRSTGRCQPP